MIESSGWGVPLRGPESVNSTAFARAFRGRATQVRCVLTAILFAGSPVSMVLQLALLAVQRWVAHQHPSGNPAFIRCVAVIALLPTRESGRLASHWRLI